VSFRGDEPSELRRGYFGCGRRTKRKAIHRREVGEAPVFVSDRRNGECIGALERLAAQAIHPRVRHGGDPGLTREQAVAERVA
jgi:hypothetical protein